MTQEQKRIKLAEAAGWKRKGKNKIWIDPGGGFDCLSDLPDYFNDLNAVHKLEGLLLDSKPVDVRSLWMDYLALESFPWPKCQNVKDLQFEVSYLSIRSTAAHRCEALGKALNLCNL